MEYAEREHHHHHVIVLPVPSQGHVNPMLQFSRRLFSKGIQVTLLIFSNKKDYHQHFQSISTSNSIKVETVTYQEPQTMRTKEGYLKCFQAAVTEALPDLIFRHGACCVVYDSAIPWVLDVAKKAEATGAMFFTQSCAVNTVYYNAHEEKLSVPVEGNVAVALPGLPVLKRNELPSFVSDTSNQYPFFLSLMTSQFSNFKEPDWVFFNSFNNLEEEVVNWLETQRPINTVGPTIPSMYLDKRLEDDKEYGFSLLRPNADTCINWLDSKERGSVVYVSFGSVAAMSEDQMGEIAWGLEKSNKHYFLWVVRDSEENKLPRNFREETSEKGLVVNWTSQLEVLAHESVGCFMTHCGWNSTVEAISLGVPMVAMPQWTDQTTNAKFITDVWKVGVRVRCNEEGLVSREEIEICVNEIMEGERGKDIRTNSEIWKNLARKALSKGGSSDKSIEKFISELVHKL